MKAVFWNKTVLSFRTVQELALSTRPEEQNIGPKATAVMSGVFIVFVVIVSTFESLIVNICCKDANKRNF